MPDNAVIDVPLARVRYFDPDSRTFHRADQPPPAPPSMPRVSPAEIGAAAGRRFALDCATFEELDALAFEWNNGLTPLWVRGFIEAALEVRDVAARDFIDPDDQEPLESVLASLDGGE
jgi:hypothetical protein